jgi:hypothetical protein
MDDARSDIITVCSGLARLQLRLQAAQYVPPGRRACDLCLRDLQPKSFWLDAAPPNVALSGVVRAVAVSLAHLLAIADARGPIDARSACLALQHIQCNPSDWGTITRRLADRLRHTLAESPYVESNGATLSEILLPRRWPRSGNSYIQKRGPLTDQLHKSIAQ